MTWSITEEQKTTAKAWITILGTVRREDRRMIAVFAVDDLGNLPVVTCDEHADEFDNLTFTAAYRHLERDAGPHALRFSAFIVQVQS